MIKAKMTVINFQHTDVITTSDYLLTGFQDGTKGNLKLTKGSVDVSSTYFTKDYWFTGTILNREGSHLADINDPTYSDYGYDELPAAAIDLTVSNGYYKLEGTTFTQVSQVKQ